MFHRLYLPAFFVVLMISSLPAQEQPASGGNLLQGALDKVGGKVTGTVGEVTNLPGSAIGNVTGGLGGITDIATGGLTESIDNAVRVHEAYPANIQTHILQDDSVTTVVLSIERVSKSVEVLPELIAEAVVKVLQETGEQQPEIRETLKVVDQNLQSVDGILLNVNSLTREANTTTVNATPLVRELTALLEQVNQGSRLANQKLELTKDQPTPEPVDLNEVNAVVQSSTATLAEVRQTVEHLRLMAEKGTLQEGTEIIGGEVEALTEGALIRVQGIVTRIIVGVILILLTFFGLLAALAWFKLWLRNKYPATQ
ncbi:MAG: hypothetical protein SFY68_09865 [Candidatus Sumerlaeia bacterium]|nr:hypothetical protein [Candidatus Sumerlaeia bacterium]